MGLFFYFFFCLRKMQSILWQKQIQKSKGDFSILTDRTEKKWLRGLKNLSSYVLRVLWMKIWLKNMSPDELRLIQLSLELVQDCTEIMGEQTRLLESMSLTIELLGKKEGVVH